MHLLQFSGSEKDEQSFTAMSLSLSLAHSLSLSHSLSLCLSLIEFLSPYSLFRRFFHLSYLSFSMIEFLTTRLGASPNKHWCSGAVSTSNLDAICWLNERGFRCSFAAHAAAKNNRVDVLRWVLRESTLPVDDQVRKKTERKEEKNATN